MTTTSSYAPYATVPEVPFLDVAAAYREVRDEIDAAVGRVLSSGTYVLGEEVDAFEVDFARYVEARHAVGVGNGLDALHLILRALDVGTGDEVVVPAHTFVATWLAVSRTGAVPVPVEPDPESYNIDPLRLEEAITPKTRAIIAVHLYGQPADLDTILEIGRCHGIPVIEDAAQAHGARHRGRRVGSLGRAAAWSFYPAKNLGAVGDAGAVTTSDRRIADRVRELRNYGSSLKHRHDEEGVNSRLDPLHAAVLRAKLPRLDAWNERRRAAARRYLEALAGSGLALPQAISCVEPVWHLFVVRTTRRDDLACHLGRLGIATQVHYPVPPHLQPVYRSLGWKPGSLPVAEHLAREVLSLPIGPHLCPDAVSRVTAAVHSFQA